MAVRGSGDIEKDCISGSAERPGLCESGVVSPGHELDLANRLRPRAAGARFANSIRKHKHKHVQFLFRVLVVFLCLLPLVLCWLLFRSSCQDGFTY